MLRSVTFERHVVTLRLERRAHLPFHHGGVVMGLLSNALGEHLPATATALVLESGRVEYEAGDRYRLGFTLVGDSASVAAQIVAGLAAVGRSRDRDGLTLGGNFRVESSDVVPAPNLEREVEVGLSTEALRLRLYTPLWVDRPTELRVPGRSRLDRDCFPAAWFLGGLALRIAKLAGVANPPPPEAGSATLVESPELLFCDVPIRGGGGRRAAEPRGKTIGGVLGSVVLAGCSRPEVEALVLGQYLHAGEKPHYGFGRYRLEPGLPEPTVLAPAHTALSRVCALPQLERALDRVAERSSAGGIDGVTPTELASERAAFLPDLAERLANGTYHPDFLLGFTQPKASGGLRALAIPTAEDRVVQRAAADVLGPAVDSLLETSSFAYRKGLSRVGAARAIERAWRDGFRFVLDADISAFFDSVPWDQLSARMRAWFPGEPLVELIDRWIRLPVVFDGRTFPRTRGLPQGLPISPLLANLYLDELDEHFLGEEFRLVRYADDFVVLTRDLESAKEAKRKAAAALELLGLELHSGKTSVRELDEGLEYLGYGFVARHAPVRAERGAPVDVATPPASWLVHVPLERIRELERGGAPSTKRPEVVRLRPAEAPAEVPLARPLVLSDSTMQVRLDGDALRLEAEGEEAVLVPIRSLSDVLVIGRPRITLPAVLELSRAGVAVTFADRFSDQYAVVDPRTPDSTLLLSQARAVEDPQLKLTFSRSIVAAKLRNAARLQVRFGLEQAAPETLRSMATRALEQPDLDLDTLRGLEGHGASVFFGSLAASLDPEWGFTKRAKRPPPDPINSLLSLGYTLLYHRAAVALRVAGLNPRLGLFHSAHGAFAALAADLMEEFRCLIDAEVRALVSKRSVRPADFVTHDGRCTLGREIRAKVLRRFELRLAKEFTPPDGVPSTYGAFLVTQAKQLADVIAVAKDSYEPLELPA